MMMQGERAGTPVFGTALNGISCVFRGKLELKGRRGL
jgi:hypothetical protein